MVTAVPTYTEIKPNTCIVEVCWRNLSARSSTLKTSILISNMTVANAGTGGKLQEFRMMKEKEQDNSSSENKNKCLSLSKEELEKLFHKIGLNRIKEWSEKDEEEARQLNGKLLLPICIR